MAGYEDSVRYPKLRSIVLDCLDVAKLAEFYRAFLGWSYAEGHDPDQAEDWLAIVGPAGGRISFQQVDVMPPTTWPSAEVPQQLHLDFEAATTEDLDEDHRRALELGAELRLDLRDDPHEPLRVYVDPAGHTFCVFTRMS